MTMEMKRVDKPVEEEAPRRGAFDGIEEFAETPEGKEIQADLHKGAREEGGGEEEQREEPAPAEPEREEPREEEPEGEEEPAPAPAAKKHKLKLNVAGTEEEYEVDEDALTNPESEGAKRLRDDLQKARDYDRKGGALDRLAARRAWDLMVEQGFAYKAADGKYYLTEEYHRFQQQRRAPQEAERRAPEVPDAKTRETEEDAELEAIYKKALETERTSDWRAYTDRRADIAARRAAAAESAKVRQELEQERSERAETDRLARIANTLEQTVTGAVTANMDAFIDPETGKPDQSLIADVRSAAFAAAAAERRVEAASATVASWARRMGSVHGRLKKAMPKPPPAGGAPNLRGGAPPGKPKPVAFDPNDPFPDKDWREFAAKELG